MRAAGPPVRALLGFIAGALSVLVFHQGTWALFHWLGLMPSPYPMDAVPPWGVPLTIDFCFWAGLYGAVLGLIWPRLTAPPWFAGLILGVIATLVLWFVVAPVKGQPLANGWAPRDMLVVAAILLVWGAGVGIILQILLSRAPWRATG